VTLRSARFSRGSRKLYTDTVRETLQHQMSSDSVGLIDPSRFIRSMRDFGIKTIEAVNEYVDNSIDAGADNIWISLVRNEATDGKTLIIEDDGHGIRADNLREVLRYGGRIDGQGETVGKFGFGLPASSICQADRTDIWTRHEADDNGFVHNRLSVEELGDRGDIPQNEYETPLPTDDYDLNLSPTADHGTVIVLRELRNPEYVQISTLAQHIEDEVGQVQRHQMAGDDGVNIWLNGDQLDIRDPLMLIESSQECRRFGKAEVWSEDTLSVEGEGYSGELNYKIVILPIKELQSISRKERGRVGVSQADQGFYLVRNDREIKGGNTLSLFKRNNDLNYFKAELRFSEELDTAFGIETNKSRCALSDQLRPRLKREIGDQIADIRKAINQKKDELREEDPETFDEAEKVFNETSKYLSPNATEIDSSERKEQEREAEKELNRVEEKLANDEGDRAQLREKKYRLLQIKETDGHVYEFEVEQPPNSEFYGFENRGKFLRTLINPNHPFYKQIFAPLDDKDIEQQIHWELMLMSLVKLENEARSEDQRKFFNFFRQDLSTTLSSLLSELSRRQE